MNKNFKIGNCPIGEGAPVFIIAEIAQAHDGSLGTAHAYIDAVAKTGANAIKFQTHIATAESSPDEKFRVNSFPQDSTRYEYWRRMEFTEPQWAGLAEHAKASGLTFLSTPFSHEAVQLLDRLGVPGWKIGSGEITNLPLLQFVANTGKPVLLSTGMSSWSDIDEAIRTIDNAEGGYAVMQCTTTYPCPPEQIGLNVIQAIRDRYSCPVGLSDHSGKIYPSLAAVTMGAHLIEVHTVFSKECFGPDVSSSVTTSELASLVEGIRFLERAFNSPIDKDEKAEQMRDLSRLFGKSIYLRHDLHQGHVLTEDDLALRKPGTGIPAKHLFELVGRVLRQACKANHQLTFGDLE
ncbi:MAG: N-acetylneuraminate synthase family protein [Proteobacteria bacterium]|nr:N-acetylneuraminate synthase family protein [Pseudomonadota bacterium]